MEGWDMLSVAAGGNSAGVRGRKAIVGVDMGGVKTGGVWWGEV